VPARINDNCPSTFFPIILLHPSPFSPHLSSRCLRSPTLTPPSITPRLCHPLRLSKHADQVSLQSPPSYATPKLICCSQSPHPHRQRNRTRHRARLQSLADQGARRRERGHSSRAAAVDLRWETDVRLNLQPQPRLHLHDQSKTREAGYTDKGDVDRADEKTAADYNLEGGNTLHLVLALRGGR
jgi:hypothetical protein